MAYVPANLTCSPCDIGNQGSAAWKLRGTDAASVVRVTGFITDGGDRGMKPGDTVEYWETDSNIVSKFVVITVASTGSGAVDLGDATTVGSGTNSD